MTMLHEFEERPQVIAGGEALIMYLGHWKRTTAYIHFFRFHRKHICICSPFYVNTKPWNKRLAKSLPKIHPWVWALRKRASFHSCRRSAADSEDRVLKIGTHFWCEWPLLFQHICGSQLALGYWCHCVLPPCLWLWVWGGWKVISHSTPTLLNQKFRP